MLINAAAVPSECSLGRLSRRRAPQRNRKTAVTVHRSGHGMNHEGTKGTDPVTSGDRGKRDCTRKKLSLYFCGAGFPDPPFQGLSSGRMESMPSCAWSCIPPITGSLVLHGVNTVTYYPRLAAQHVGHTESTPGRTGVSAGHSVEGNDRPNDRRGGRSYQKSAATANGALGWTQVAENVRPYL